MKRATPPKPEFLLREFADDGAALTLHPDGHRRTFVISPVLMLKEHALVYHAAEQELPEGMHVLHFDKLSVADENRIEFIRNGVCVAYLCPVEVDGDKSLQIWTLWNHWRADHNLEYYDEVTVALRDSDDENA